MSQNAVLDHQNDGDRLLFLVRPPLEIVDRIDGLRRNWGEQALRHATLVRRDILHCTIAPFRRMPDIQRSLIDQMLQAGQGVDGEAFELTFDAVKAVGDWVGLTGCGADVKGAKRLRETVITTIERAKLQDHLVGSSFNPHMTLLYRNVIVSSYRIEPLRFRVDELVLVRSHVGKTRHEEIARWSLQPPRQLSLTF